MHVASSCTGTPIPLLFHLPSLLLSLHEHDFIKFENIMTKSHQTNAPHQVELECGANSSSTWGDEFPIDTAHRVNLQHAELEFSSRGPEPFVGSLIWIAATSVMFCELSPR